MDASFSKETLIRVVSRRHIPRGCRTNYIPGLTEESQSLYEAYKKQYTSNPFAEGTLETGNKLIDTMKRWEALQTTQPTSGGAVTVVSSCCANCVEPPRPQQWGPDLPFFGHADPLDGWCCCSQKLVMSRPIRRSTTLNKKVWICDICHNKIHVRKQISIRCNRIEHWVHLRCAGIRQAQYTDTWTFHLHRESRLTQT